MMKRQWCVCGLLLILTQAFTGQAESKISAQLKKSKDILTFCCRLLGEDRVTQVNWVLTRGNDTIKLGTYHPVFGIHIYAQINVSVEIQGNATERSSHLILKSNDVKEESIKICCIFNSFPSGVLEKCTATNTEAEFQGADALANWKGEYQQTRSILQWSLLLVGFLIYILSTVVCLYYCIRYCRRCNFWRRRVNDVQRCPSDCSTTSEETTTNSQNEHESAPRQPKPSTQPQPQPHPQPLSKGFDHSKLYAKIKLDLLYGRLWKAYQGTGRTWNPAAPKPQTLQKVYSRLGEYIPQPEVPTESRPPKVTLQIDLLSQPDPEIQSQHSDCLSNNVLPCQNADHNSEASPPASQPESQDLTSEPKCDHVTLPGSTCVPDQADSGQSERNSASPEM